MISPRSILATVDFSEASPAALALAARLARRFRAEPHVLFVEDPLLDAAAARAGLDLAAASRAELRRLIWHEWSAPECSPHLHVVAGPEADVILAVARAQAADLIVVPNCQMPGVDHVMFGSMTKRLLRKSDVSVLVAPAGWTPPDDEAEDGAAAADGVLDDVVQSRVEVVRGPTGSAARRIAYRALAAATMPILMHIVDGVLG